MMYRKHNSLMKFSRTERLAQLSQQENVIEKKKREIQAKLEAQKNKATEEALKKLESSSYLESKITKISQNYDNRDSRSISEEKQTNSIKENVTNVFSNDGSFLDQFKKLSQTGMPSVNPKFDKSNEETGHKDIESSSSHPQNSESSKETNKLSSTLLERVSLTLKPNVVKKLENIPNPLSVYSTSLSESTSTDHQNIIPETGSPKESHGFSSALANKSVSCHSQPSSTFYHDDYKETGGDSQNKKHWAELVAQYGDKYEDYLLCQHKGDSSLRFLLEKNSKEYLDFRQIVETYRKSLLQKNNNPENSIWLNNLQNNFTNKEDGESRVATKTVSHTTENQNNKSHSDKVFQNESSIITNFNLEKVCSQSNQHFINEQFSGNLKKGNQSSKDLKREEGRTKKRKSRWGDAEPSSSAPPIKLKIQPPGQLPSPKSSLLSKITRSDPGLIQYARQTFGSVNLSEEDWKKAEDHYKINLLYQDMLKKREQVEKLEKQGKFKYEYDSDEDTEGGTWEHKLRQQEMQATQLWAEELTRQAAGKHHIGDFLPPDELKRFMEKYNAVKEGREPDLSDYKEFKLKEDNVGYRLLQKMGWNEGQGLGQDGSGITNPVNKANTRYENQGLGVERPDGLGAGDDEYDAYRKRMMLAYRFRPNPLNNPRRPYY